MVWCGSATPCRGQVNETSQSSQFEAPVWALKSDWNLGCWICSEYSQIFWFNPFPCIALVLMTLWRDEPQIQQKHTLPLERMEMVPVKYLKTRGLKQRTFFCNAAPGKVRDFLHQRKLPLSIPSWGKIASSFTLSVPIKSFSVDQEFWTATSSSSYVMLLFPSL